MKSPAGGALIGLKPRQRFAVYSGDCLKLLERMATGAVANIISDPPYDDHVHSKNRRIIRGGGRAKSPRSAVVDGKVVSLEKSLKMRRKYREVGLVPLDFNALTQQDRELAAEQFARVCRRWCVLFSNAEATHLWRKRLVSAGLQHVRVGAWVKLCAQPQLTGDRPGTGIEELEIAHSRRPKWLRSARARDSGSGLKVRPNPLYEKMRWNGGGLPAVWTHRIATSNNGEGERFHTTQKPLSLMLELIEQFTEPDEIVLDPYAGSGTTLIAALRLGRRAIGIERDKRYAEIARERCEAEVRGLNLSDARAGQESIFDKIPKPLGA